MDDSKDILDVVNFVKDRMLTKDDVRVIVKEEVVNFVTKEDLKPIKDRLFAIEGKLDGINRRVDREAERNFEQDTRLTKLEQKVV